MNKRVKIAFMGAGSTIFLKNTIGDAFMLEGLRECDIALYDIDEKRLQESQLVIEALNNSVNKGRARISAFLGQGQRKDALRGADFVCNAIQVGGYDPATIIDFEIPKKYGLRQTIGDTHGIGGIFRALRTIPVMLDFVRDMETVCPNALFLNYTNPMAMVSAAIQQASPIQSVGLCHSVQVCVPDLLKSLDMEVADPHWKIAGINHTAWLLEIFDGEKDIYPEIKRRAAAKNKAALNGGGKHPDMVRFEMMKLFAHYVTESSEHNAEYSPYWIRRDNEEGIEQFNIPLDEYPRRCREQIAAWNEARESLMKGEGLEHELSREYGSRIMNAVFTDTPYSFHGNLLNTSSYISNLPKEALVEVLCLADGSGIHGTYVGDLPPQCAALNRINVNVQIMTVEAARSHRREAVYQAALLDPHTSAELPPGKIIALCEELFEAHRQWLPEYR